MPENDLPQPFPVFRDWMVHSAPQLHLDVEKLRPHAVAPGLPFKLEGSLAGFPTDEREPQEHKGLRFSETLSLALGRSMATKLNQPGLVGMERQRELLKSCSHRIEEATCVVLALEAND